MPTVRNKPGGARSSIRFEPPTLDEAIFAVQGLADDVGGQTEIAAMLMGLPEDQVRAAHPESCPTRPCTEPPVSRTPVGLWTTGRRGRAASSPHDHALKLGSRFSRLNLPPRILPSPTGVPD
ncbi:hypothetical protein [Microvirga aerophila]|uniref:hypothetical protein n=1 Tax=Microvirga aerophila TaxID=670291 RepID=UPI001FEFC32C|nr:hypothetical protein [Microvirga aerophila]